MMEITTVVVAELLDVRNFSASCTPPAALICRRKFIAPPVSTVRD